MYDIVIVIIDSNDICNYSFYINKKIMFMNNLFHSLRFIISYTLKSMNSRY